MSWSERAGTDSISSMLTEILAFRALTSLAPEAAVPAPRGPSTSST